MGAVGLFMKLIAHNGFVFGRVQLSGAFKIVGQFRDVNNVGWGMLLEFIDPDGIEKREHFRAADMHNVVDSVTGSSPTPVSSSCRAEKSMFAIISAASSAE